MVFQRLYISKFPVGSMPPDPPRRLAFSVLAAGKPEGAYDMLSAWGLDVINPAPVSQ